MLPVVMSVIIVSVSGNPHSLKHLPICILLPNYSANGLITIVPYHKDKRILVHTVKILCWSYNTENTLQTSQDSLCIK